ncbi:MAG: tetratricopeptide repeat protein [Deltaproteobacteria bacterium]|nr:tetratricopeptide repeat protein [Deltaproteobacteria bacterium]
MIPAPARSLMLAAAALLAAGPAVGSELKDLYFGEALYYAYQEQYFEALERLDSEIAQHYRVDEPKLDSLRYHIGHAEFSVGDFELYYRMHHRAGRAIKAVLEGNVEDTVRNEAAFRLAKIHFEKDQPDDALQVLERISGRIPEPIQDDVEFLRANIYLATGRPSEAVDVLRRLQDSKGLKGFSTYNLGIALLRGGQPKEAVQQLDRAGRVKGRDRSTLAIRDKSNLVLGTLLLESSEFGLAQRSLDRVRLAGPFSNLALLRAGRADASAEKFERALVPWSILVKREATDPAVQEAMLALPYAYGKLKVHGRAAVLYGEAVETFSDELEKLASSINNIENGEFLEALVREEIRQDKDWVIRLRSLPDTPETFYLITLMASHDFQTALQNYLDLEDLRKKLVSWQRSLDSFDDIIRLRRDYYEPILPEIDRQFRKLDAQVKLRLEQRKHLRQRLEHMLIAPRPDLLATADEQLLKTRIDRLESKLHGKSESDGAGLKHRIDRLAGVLAWGLETQYHERLTDAHRHLRELNDDVAVLTAQYDAFVRSRQAATHSYVGYEAPINSLRVRAVRGIERVNTLMARQGKMLESVAISELEVRKERLEVYQNQARFAYADSYDRAAKAQAR